MKDRQTILVVLACLVALVTWQWLIHKFFPPIPKRPQPVRMTNAVSEVPPVAPEAAAPTTAVEVAAPPPAIVATAAAEEPETPRPAEQVVVLSNAMVRVEVTSWGGGIRSVELLQHRANGQRNVILNGPDFVPALAIAGLADADAAAVYELRQSDQRTVELRRQTRAGELIMKRLILGDDYLLSGTVELQRPQPLGKPGPRLELTLGTALPASPAEGEYYLSVDWLAGERFQSRNFKQIEKFAARNQLREPLDARWVAVKSQFFTMILTPLTNATAVSYAPVPVPAAAHPTGQAGRYGISGTAQLPPSVVLGSGLEIYKFTYYAGPKDYDRLVALGKGQDELMQFGMFGFFSIILLKSMKFCHNLIPNWGVAIIIITVLIKLLFWPIQAKAIRSMKEMQKFQPLLAKIKEKYKDDPQRQNAELMKLYKEHKINPFAGCLPMLVQIPVFFALFAMLRSAIELRGARFLWVKDLSQPDTVFHLFGLPVNPLPLVMTGSMIWQQKITPTTGDPQQARMMMFMPLLMLLFFYNASSGLALYWTVQQLLSIAQQWWSLRQPAPPNAATPGGAQPS